MERVKKLNVLYNGVIVGYLAEVENGKIGFQYDDGWCKSGFSISPFSLPISDKIYYSSKPLFGGLFGVFNDSLPDGWGELLVKRMLAKKGINYDRLSSLTKLALVSGNGLGGLTYEPTLAEKGEVGSYDLDVLCADVQKIFDDEAREDADLDAVFLLGGSSGGARPKAHISVNGEEWIVKFPCRMDPPNIGAEEFEANRLAHDCKIHTNEFAMFPSKRCKGYFGTKRFDRCGNKRIHMISLSAILETTHRVPNLDYLHLFQVVQNICVDKTDLYETFRRMAFNVFYGNKDDHGKNFSFLFDEELNGYKVSPAYDLTRTLQKPEHEMTVNGNGNPTEADLMQVAQIMKLNKKRCEQILSDCKNIL